MKLLIAFISTCLILAPCTIGCSTNRMDDQNQHHRSDRSRPDADDLSAELDKELEAITAAFMNRRTYPELSPDIIRDIPDEHLIQAIVDFIGIRIGQDWEHDVEKIPSLGAGFSAVYFLSLLQTEVNNGGFNQIFYNDSRQAVLHAREGARLVRLRKLAAVIDRALAIEQSTRAKAAAARAAGTIDAFMVTYAEGDFEAIDEEYFALADGIDKSLIKFIRRNATLFSGKADGQPD